MPLAGHATVLGALQADIATQLQRLRGLGDVFQEFELRTRVDLESGHLVFVGSNVPISSVLMLVPWYAPGGTKTASRNACCFINGSLGDASLGLFSLQR